MSVSPEHIRPGLATGTHHDDAVPFPRIEADGPVAHGERDSWLVHAHRSVRYEVRIRDRVFDLDHTDVLEAGGRGDGGSPRRFVVVDDEVDRVHGERIRGYLDHHGVDYAMTVLAASEASKEFDTAARVLERLDAFAIARRSEPVIIIGGGVLLDVAGLAASLYRRGTPFLRVPTTLIGLVDAGIGVKTGVNFNGHKNRLGTYAPADLTLLDRTFLGTLDRRQISNGLGEILKIALIKDLALFELLERHGAALLDERFQGLTPAGDDAARTALRRAVDGMLAELTPNLWEDDLERRVDYGHTFSPTLEMSALPALLHGEAVCVDMALTTVLACRRGLVTVAERDRVLAIMRTLELPCFHPLLDSELLVRALADTVRHRDGRQRLPLPLGIGEVCFVDDVTAEELATSVEIQRDLCAPALVAGRLGRQTEDVETSGRG
ncbi:sedoheptulose 7-phosphate cyclase [Actinoalloteichus fjordicus]|uniref:2-epi-5-epi-valiolone synthase n=1 Tax=Actinoalloteichus fjordicus TaxID=1612552 RepID=A0AAC9PTP4_9PSEU|nr:sedoheptulose 7-phosphate cyclase [Actinoalloteichus fjordicus]APU16235.1 3-dehydroquinate synthase [Actinoalloteichus fjordicus]